MAAICIASASFAAFAAPASADDTASYRKALQEQNTAKLYRLIDHVDDVDMQLENGRTALMVAAKHGEPQLVEKLLASGADVNLANENGGTALMFSSLSGDVATVRKLLESGAAVNATGKFDWTAIMVAAAKGYDDIVTELISHDAEPNIRDVYQWTPLMRAAYSGHADAVNALLAASDVDIDALDENAATALHHAATEGHYEVVRILIAHGANADLSDRFGLTPKERAETQKHDAVYQLLAQ